jgi:uncharacterized hydrophobic protein (TIGR00271 family)
MQIAIYINETSQVERMINWGIRAATAEHYDLLVIVPRRQTGAAKWDSLLKEEAEEHEIFQAVFSLLEACDRVALKEDVAEQRDYAEMDRIVVETRELVAPNPAESLVDMVDSLESVRLILPAVNDLKSDDEGASWAQRLFLQAPCETMMVWGSPPPLDKPIKILVAADAESESPLAARRAVQFSRSSEGGKATLLYVWPDDDEVAPQIAQRKAKAIVSGSGISDKSDIESTTVIGNSLIEAIQAQESKIFNTIVYGSRNIKKIRTLVRGLRNKDDGKSMIVVRPSVSIGRKVLRNCQGSIRQLVPQLEREERIALVEKLETNSKFNFDFCALISLSTLIAALGLADNSTAVVIGAMLVAPLMTPLVGIGFALIQGNLDLIRNARWAVLIGFANAFAVGVFIGLLMLIGTDITSTEEMVSRDAPSLLDLLVALASGIAGAYAMSRKGLNGAIPGVAIAAALVPPIATSGMYLALGQLTLSVGAFLLFLTNVVFIVLGTAMVFWSIGIDTRKQKSKGDKKSKQYVWTRYWFGAFVIASLVLAISMAVFNPLKHAKKEAKEQNQTELEQTQTEIEQSSIENKN